MKLRSKCCGAEVAPHPQEYVCSNCSLSCIPIVSKIRIERACAKADKQGKVITHAVASLEWKEREMRKLGLNPKSGIDRAFFEEINE